MKYIVPMKKHKVPLPSLRQLMAKPEFVNYFKTNRVNVAGTLFSGKNPLLVRQHSKAADGSGPYLIYKLPGGIIDSAFIKEESYILQLRTVLEDREYSFHEKELLIRRERAHFSGRTLPEVSFIIKFLEETGLMPLTFAFGTYQTRFSAKPGEEKDPDKSFIQLFFIVHTVYDACVQKNYELRAAKTIKDRSFFLYPNIVDPRVRNFSVEQALKIVINNHKEPLMELASLHKDP